MEEEIKPTGDKFVPENADKKLQEARAEADRLTIRNEADLGMRFNFFEEALD